MAVMTALSIGLPLVLVANTVYSIPAKATIIAWQSVAGGDLLGSLDGAAFLALATSAANEVKTVTSGAKFIKTAVASTTVVVL